VAVPGLSLVLAWPGSWAAPENMKVAGDTPPNGLLRHTHVVVVLLKRTV